jgi:hypothetical protein
MLTGEAEAKVFRREEPVRLASILDQSFWQ